MNGFGHHVCVTFCQFSVLTFTWLVCWVMLSSWALVLAEFLAELSACRGNSPWLANGQAVANADKSESAAIKLAQLDVIPLKEINHHGFVPIATAPWPFNGYVSTLLPTLVSHNFES